MQAVIRIHRQAKQGLWGLLPPTAHQAALGQLLQLHWHHSTLAVLVDVVLEALNAHGSRALAQWWQPLGRAGVGWGVLMAAMAAMCYRLPGPSLGGTCCYRCCHTDRPGRQAGGDYYRLDLLCIKVIESRSLDKIKWE